MNNHAVQFIRRSILDISREQLSLTFENNVFSFFYLIQAALPHMTRGASIINTASVTAYQGNRDLIDYSATKGAIVALTRSLSLSAGGAGNPRERGGAGANLDTADSRVLFGGGGGDVRLRNLEGTHVPRRPALRSLCLLCVPGV